MGTPDYGGAGEEDSEEEDGAPLDPHLLPPPPPPAPDALQALPDDVRLAEAQWRDFLASPKRRRHFSGCFGARLARIGSHTGLGCSNYKTRKSLCQPAAGHVVAHGGSDSHRRFQAKGHGDG